MPSQLTLSHIEAERRLRLAVNQGVERIWRNLPGYDRENVDQWLSTVLPLIEAGKRASTSLTDAYLARALERPAFGVPVPDVRNGVPSATAYERPFVTTWTALGAGTAYADAVSSGLARATEMAAFDVQAAMRQTANTVQREDPNIYGYQRVADGAACAFCVEVDGAYVKNADAMPLHNNCGCSLEPLTSPHSRAANLPSGVAVHQHGEMGPVLTSPDHDFTSPSDI